jgi:hypothetical protein
MDIYLPIAGLKSGALDKSPLQHQSSQGFKVKNLDPFLVELSMYR